MRNRMRFLFVGLVVALGVSLPLVGEGTASHLLLRETPVPDGFTIAFVGDGFTEAELPIYGKAVNDFVKKLRKRDVFDTHRSRFNFYRIDVVDPNGETENKCSPEALAKLTAVSVDGDPFPPVDGTEVIDLRVQHCWGGNDAPVMYTEAEDAAITLAAGIPDLKVVVIVANARLNSGGTQAETYSSDTVVVVVGSLVRETSEGSNLYEIDEMAVATLTHELGHAMGLLDEYEHQNTNQLPGFKECRNIWKPDAAPQWPGTPTWPASEKPIPWQGIMINCCSPQTMVRCQSHEPEGSCVLQDLEISETYCSFVPRSGNPHEGCDPPPECELFPGAWEGGFYTNEEYYRATKEHCRMYSMGVEERFCAACRQYLDIYLEHFGENATTGPWPEERCDSSGCPPATTVDTQLPESPGNVWRSDEQ